MRDCETCIYKTVNGCTAWECEYINIDDAIEAFKELQNVSMVKCIECELCKEKGTYDCPSGYGYLYCTKWNTMTDETRCCGWGKKK